jgi:PAS domain S-box-containing protein
MANATDQILFGKSEIAHLLRNTDWDSSPLGPPEAWPHTLRTVVSLMLNSKFPMFVAWGPELGVLYNDAYIDILGEKHPWALGQPFESVWSEIWADISPIVDKAMAGEASYFENLPLTMYRKGYKEETWFTFSYSPVYDETGRVAGMHCTCTETTHQVLAEQERIDENERFRTLFQQAPGIIAVLRHRNHTFEIANEAYYSLVGHRDLIGKPVKEALPEVAGQGLFELLDTVYTTGEPYVGRAVPVKLQRHGEGDLDERYVDFVYQPIRNKKGRVSGIFVEGSDVTEAVRTTNALRESEQQLRQLANTIPNLAWMADATGSVHWYNDRFYEYTGLTFEEAVGDGWQKIHARERQSAVKEEFVAALANGDPFEMTLPLRSAAGEYRIFYTKVAPLRNSAGEIIQWFGTNTDIHQIEKAQEALKASNRRKDEFLAMLAHELRNPLAPISTAAEILKLPNLDRERIASTSTIITRQVSHMTDLVDDLLDVSRVTRGLVHLHKEDVDITSVITDAVEQVSHSTNAKHQEIRLDVPEAPVIVQGDRTRLTQIVANILNNASRYTAEKGRINVQMSRSEDELQLSIRDNGIGMDEDLLPHIFDLFTQAERSPDRAQGGLGLGLALVKSLVELHGGHVSVHSAGRNQGSEIVVRLPHCTPITQRITSPSASAPANMARGNPDLTVMIVDDNVDAAQTLSMLLSSYGYQTLAEYSAMDAIKCVDKYKPQIIILDIGLPEMDGYELAHHLGDMPSAAGAVFIALTGYGQDQDRERSQEAGFAHHLVKPVNIQALLSALQDVENAFDHGDT